LKRGGFPDLAFVSFLTLSFAGDFKPHPSFPHAGLGDRPLLYAGREAAWKEEGSRIFNREVMTLL